MKGLRLERWAGQLLSARFRPSYAASRRQIQSNIASTRAQSTSAAIDASTNDDSELGALPIPTELPSPPPEAALKSAKLAALHARLSLPRKIPLQVLSRTLVDRSADRSSSFNNASLAQIGASLLSFHVSEWLLCTYPRLPMAVLFAAMHAYVGPPTLRKIGQEWGVETAAYPGAEVDPGLLQYTSLKPGAVPKTGTSARNDHSEHFRRGMSSRVVYDNEFGDPAISKTAEDAQPQEQAYANFVRALIGSVHLHAGRRAASDFIKAHILSRHLPISELFQFKQATRDLSRLCARENFEYPVARILSETGRHSRSPVFVVGIFSGEEKLGEGAGASLNEARTRAAIAALKAWYLYSPNAGQPGKLPSHVEDKEKWDSVHIDIGEIV